MTYVDAVHMKDVSCNSAVVFVTQSEYYKLLKFIRSTSHSLACDKVIRLLKSQSVGSLRLRLYPALIP